MERREFLRASGTIAAASAVGLAGCLGDSGDSFETTDWLPAPAELNENLEYYSIFSTAPATVAEYEDQLSAETWENYQQKWLDWTIASPEAGEVTRYIEGQSPEVVEQDEGLEIDFILVEHTLDDGTLADAIQEQGFEETDSHDGFDMYQTPDGAGARALDDGTLVATAATDDGVAVAEKIVDSGAGNADRYVDSSSEVSSITEALDTEHNFRFEDFQQITQTRSSRGVFEGSVGRGYSTVLEDEQVRAKRVEEFTEGTDIQQEGIRTFTDENPLFSGADNLETTTENNQLIIDWTADLGTLTLNQLG